MEPIEYIWKRGGPKKRKTWNVIRQTLCLSRQSRQFRYLLSVEPVSHSLRFPIGLRYDSWHASLPHDGSRCTMVFDKVPAKAK